MDPEHREVKQLACGHTLWPFWPQNSGIFCVCSSAFPSMEIRFSLARALAGGIFDYPYKSHMAPLLIILTDVKHKLLLNKHF